MDGRVDDSTFRALADLVESFLFASDSYFLTSGIPFVLWAAQPKLPFEREKPVLGFTPKLTGYPFFKVAFFLVAAGPPGGKVPLETTEGIAASPPTTCPPPPTYFVSWLFHSSAA